MSWLNHLSFKKQAAGLGQPQSPSPAQPQGALPLKPMAAIPTADGQRPKPTHPQMKPLQAGQPNFQGMQPNAQAWRPSAVAPVAASKGDPNAWIMSLFKPQQQPQQKVATNMQGATLQSMAIEHFLDKPTVAMIHMGRKFAATHATGDPLPEDFNGHMHMPTKDNGGIGSYGADAWHSFNKYHYSWARPFDLKKDWHVKDAYVTKVKVDPGLSEAAHVAHKRLVDKSKKGKPTTLARVESTSLPPIDVKMEGKK